MTSDRHKDRRRQKGPVKKERRAGERRTEPRFVLDLWVEAEEGEALYFQRVGNLSAGGCSFLQTVPHPIGTKVKLRFTLPDAPTDEVSCSGEIVSVRDHVLEMGVRFVGLPEKIKLRIRNLAVPLD